MLNCPGRRTERSRFGGRDLQAHRFYAIRALYGRAGKAPEPGDRKDFVKTLRLSAALAALTLTASTTCAGVIDLSNVLGPSGGYTSQAYYQTMLGGQPMTSAQQAYADQEDQLRLLGFLSELGGDIALGQSFYHMAYGITPPPSALDLAGGESDPHPPSITPSGLVTGASGVGYTGAGLTTPINTGVGPAIAAPEASTWAMVLTGFAALTYAACGKRSKGLRCNG